MGIRRTLALLVTGTLVPLLAFSAVATYQSGREQDAAAERALVDATRTLVVALDKHFEGTITTLRALGTSEHLDSGDLAAFHQQCRRAREVREEWRAISLFDSTGRRLFITTEPFGAALPGPPPTMTEPFRRLVETRTPNVSDLFRSPLTNRYAMSVGVPIVRDGDVRWVISAGMTPDAVGKLMTSDRVLSDWTATVFDRGYRIAGGTHGGAIGDAAPASFVEVAKGALEGAVRRRTDAGSAALTAFSRSRVFGWTVSIAVPIDGGFFRAPVRNIFVVGVGLLAIGLVIAVWAARRISRPIEALAVSAREIGRGETVTPVRSGVKEIAALSTVLTTASQERARAETDLAKSNERLQILHQIDRGLVALDAPEAIAEAALPRVREVLGVPRVIVNLFDLATGEVEWLAAAGRRRTHVGPGIRYSLALAGDVEALRRGVPQVIDVESLPPGPDKDALLASGVETYMVVPMIAGGELIGSFSFGGPRGPFQPEQVAIAREVAAQMAIAIAQARLHERVRLHAVELEDKVRERTSALEAVQEELVRKERLATLGQIAGSVAHELRNPLGVIKNSIYYLRMIAPEEERIAKHLRILEREIATSNRIVGELLDFARTPAPRRVATNLNEIVRDYLERNGAPTDVVLSVELADDLPGVEADPDQLGLVFANLVRNAVQAMSRGGRLTIATARHGDGSVDLTVSDTGVGISSEDRARIFEPLFTTKAKGFGLGLAVVKRLTEANGGEVDFDSEPGRGSRFRLRFRSSSYGPQ